MKNAKTAPDGGWGYACVVGLALCQLLFGMTLRAFGVIYLITLEKFHTTATVAAWVGGFNALSWGAFAPLASFFCQKYSARVVAFAGTILLFSGFLLTAFATHIAMLYFSFGLMTGIGAACATSSGYITVSQYFDKKRALATSIGSAGGSVGILFLAPLINFMAEYYGYRGCMVIVAGICLHGFVSAALFRPLISSNKYDTTALETEPTIKEMEKEEENKLEEQYKKGPRKHLELHLTDSIESGINVDIHYQSSSGINKPVSKKQKNKELVVNNNKCCSKLQGIFSVLCEEPTIIGVILINASGAFSGTVMTTFAPALAVDENISQTNAVLLLTSSGTADLIGRIVIGYIMDTHTLKPYMLSIYTICSSLASIALILYPLVAGSYIWYTCINVFHNMFVGTILAQRTTVVANILGLERMPVVFGILQLVNAVGLTSGRGIGGLLKDSLGHYNYIFYLAGLFSLSCCVIMFILILIDKNRLKTSKQISVEDSVANS